MAIREIDIAVISDLHLATQACSPKKILNYLKSIHTDILVLNGDIIDSWRFSRNYFPKSHSKVIRQLLKMMEKGIQVVYITGNHDEFLRKFNLTHIGNFKIVNQFIIELMGEKTWIFHGDIFDDVIHQSKWLAKIGSAVYGYLSVFNKMVNQILIIAGKNEIILYKKLKKYLVKDKLNLSKFESLIGNAAISQGYKNVICGHTHFPKEKQITINEKTIRYLNCGDWVEHFTAVEYYNGDWHLNSFEEINDDSLVEDPEIPEQKQLYISLVNELSFSNILV